MRTTLLALLLGLAACKSDEAPKVSASATNAAVAGTVVDIKGTVTIAGKPLAKGDTVAADALIDTGADSSVTILLAHNGVKLELGANKHVRVNESVAWNAPKRVEPGDGPEAATMSAGRPAERNAAETSITAVETATAAAVEPAAGAPSDRADDGAAAPPPTPAKENEKATESKKVDNVDDSFGEGGLGLTGVGQGGGGQGDGVGLGGIGTIGHGAGSGQGTGYGTGKGRLGGKKSVNVPTVKTGAAEVQGTLPKDVIQRIVRRNMNQIRFCYEKGLQKDPGLAGKLSVKFVIGADGNVPTAANDGSTIGDTTVVDCTLAVFKRMTFPKPDGGGVVIVKYPIVLAPSQ